jgi:uncharacterized membrane protein HdeD (DUF308 family)
MTNQTDTQLPTGPARRALVSGIVSLVLVILYLVTPLGPIILYVSIISGIIAIVAGIIALRKREHAGVSITGIITGVLGALTGVSILIFALVFVGAIG